ncbi:MAG: putative secreted protein, SAP61-like [Rapeseed phyllody phytoplasma]|uniref:Putative secreted protein, SAP61-like n=1 Tax=Rapeseed phyllody phytoplasma TaxID=2490543 RepID=A0A859I9W5_9MOLU|nr:MAG: putative secreted protein, SAP61-like [Rapeseed phyllody phytoplasma]
MLKKSVKNNYLIFLIVITFVFISCFLSAFIPSAFADDKKDPKEKTTPVSESPQSQGPKLGVVDYDLVQSFQDSLNTKTSLSCSCVAYKMKLYLKAKNPKSQSEVGTLVEFLYSSVLGVDYWENIEVDNFDKCTYDDDNTKANLISILTMIFKEAKTLLSNVDESCLLLVEQLNDKLFASWIQDTVKSLWVK